MAGTIDKKGEFKKTKLSVLIICSNLLDFQQVFIFVTINKIYEHVDGYKILVKLGIFIKMH